MAGIEIINQRVREEIVFVTSLKQEVGKVIVGQSELIDRLIIGLLTNGHVLLEGFQDSLRRLPFKPSHKRLPLISSVFSLPRPPAC